MTTAERNDAICKDYVDGMTFYDLGQKYQLSRQWLNKILERAHIPLRPRSESRVNRDTFLGANIGEETKVAVTELAQKKGVSVSAVTDQALQDYVKLHEMLEIE